MITLDTPGTRVLPRLVLPTDQPSVPFLDGQLHIGLQLDDGTTRRPVTEADLLHARTSIDALLPRALAALRADTNWRDWQVVHTVPGMEAYLAGDGVSASRLLIFDHLVHAWPLGGVVVAVPASDQLMAVRLDSTADLDALNVMVTAAHYACTQSDRGLSDQVFWNDGERWHHLSVVHGNASIAIEPPSEFMEAIGRLAAMEMVGAVAEA
jgi:hypothetical protein